MNYSSYNKPNPSISRLDQLLTRNQLIYQNLKQKLEGINQSNRNIYKNITNINSNYNQNFLHQSSAIERESTIKQKIPSYENYRDSSPQKNHNLPSIEQHSQITFSDYQNRGSQNSEEKKIFNQLIQEERLKQQLKQEEKLRYQLLILEKERLLEQEKALLSQQSMHKRRRTQRSRQIQEEQLIRKNQIKYIDTVKQANGKRQEQQKNQEKERMYQIKTPIHKSAISLIKTKPEQPVIGQAQLNIYEQSSLSSNNANQRNNNNKSAKSNSIYLHQLPKSSIIEVEGQTEVPTFRDVNVISKGFTQSMEIQEFKKLNNQIYNNKKQKLQKTINMLNDRIDKEMNISPRRHRELQLKRDYGYQSSMKMSHGSINQKIKQNKQIAHKVYSDINYNRDFVQQQTNKSVGLDNLQAKSQHSHQELINSNHVSSRSRSKSSRFRYLKQQQCQKDEADQNARIASQKHHVSQQNCANEIEQRESNSANKNDDRNEKNGKDSPFAHLTNINESNVANLQMNTQEEAQQRITIKRQRNNISIIADCYLFVPFNKVYRSPILQLKIGCAYLQRKSKTTPLTKRQNKILDPILYKIRNIITDQQQLINQLMSPVAPSQNHQQQRLKIGIVGGKQVSKKKIHCNILNKFYGILLNKIQINDRSMIIKIQHQEIALNEEPLMIQQTIDAYLTSKRVSIMKLDKIISDIIQSINKTYSSKKKGKKLIRVTKLEIFRDGQKSEAYSVISSNRYDIQFLRMLKVAKLCFAINPLVKHYDQVKQTLDSLKQYLKCSKST